LWRALGWRGLVGEIVDWGAVRMAALHPATRRTWRNSTIRLMQNRETRARLPRNLPGATEILNHVLFVDAPVRRRRPAGSSVLWAAALEPRKGGSLAIRALAQADERVRLHMVGDGPERQRLEQLARRLGVSRRVEFLGRLPRDRVLELLSEAPAALFTGLREEGGVALAEAMRSGTPVIVLANGGARTVAEAATDRRRVELIEIGSMDACAKRLAAAMDRFVVDPPTSTTPLLDRRSAIGGLQGIFDGALSRR
jgi:glycosyltransferase involved in cell wall biosynthesis